MNNDAILASISKIHAYRYAKEKQRGVKLGYNEPPTQGTTTKFVIPSIAIGTDDFSLEYYGNTYGGDVGTGKYNIYQASIFSMGPTPLGANGIYNISLGGESIGVLNFNLTDSKERFHLVISRQGITVKIYINGELKITKDQSEVKDLGDLQLAIANSSDVALLRVWNYALSADEITTLYNNGNPLGYIVPKAMKDIDYSIELTGIKSYTWNGVDSSFSIVIPAIPVYVDRYYKVNITVSNYESGTPFIYAGTRNYIPASNGTYDILIHNTEYTNKFIMYGGENGSDRRLTLTINSVTPVGCIAEYVAPNLIANIVRSQIANIISENSYFWDNVTTGAPNLDIRTNPGIKPGFTYKVNLTVSNFVEGEPYLYAGSKVNITAADGTYDLVITPSGKYDYISVYGGINTQTKNLKITVNSVTLISVASTWLDSAKQLSWSDKYLPPLLQSKGGYDMVANGSPEVLFNE